MSNPTDNLTPQGNITHDDTSPLPMITSSCTHTHNVQSSCEVRIFWTISPQETIVLETNTSSKTMESPTNEMEEQAEDHMNLFGEFKVEEKEKNRERNREHAKKTRLRKKATIEIMKDRLLRLQKEVQS